MNVLVFRTNVNSDALVHQLACRLCKLRTICRWSIDMEDCDCVLRIEADSLTEADVVRLVNRANLFCEPLTT